MVKQVVLGLILTLWGVVGLAQSPLPESIQQAQSAYADGDMARAIMHYEAALAEGFATPEVFHNLGNAYYESGELGRALLFYLRAYRDLPRDPQVNLNITLVRALRVDVQTEETALPDLIAEFTSGIMTQDELGTLTLMLWWLCFGAVVLWLLRPHWRERLRPWLWGMGGVLLIVGVLYGGRAYTESYRPRAVIVTPDARIMTGPGDGYPFLFELYSAAELRVLERRAGWVRFALPDGRQGWVIADAVEEV